MKTSLIGAALLIISPVALAELAWSVDTGVGHTDNARLTPTNTESDTLPWVGGMIEFEREGRRLRASLAGQGSYVHYMDDTFDDDFVGSAAGFLELGIVPETFLWTIEDHFGQASVDQFEPVTPENRQNINTFTTGPDFIARLGSQSQLRLAARFSDTTYERSDEIDTQTLTGSISFVRNLSPNTSWAIVAAAQRIDYDAPGVETYEQPSLYVSWQSRGARQALAVDLGANRVEGFGDSHTKPLLRLNWSRRIAPSWTLDANAAAEYRNTSEQFIGRRRLGVSPAATTDLGISAAPAETYEGGLALTFERLRTRFSVGGGYSQLNYVVDTGLDEDSWFGFTQLSRRFTPRLQGFLTYRIEKKDFEDVGQDDTDQTAELGLDWRAGKSLFLTLGYNYSDSDSSSFTNTYTSNVVYLTVSYRYGTTSQPRSFAN